MTHASEEISRHFIKGESKVLEFRYFDRFGSPKDVSSDKFTLKIADEDNSEIWLTKNNADFDTTDASHGRVRVRITPDKTGVFEAELQRDEGGATGELDRFNFSILVDSTVYDI